MSELRLEEEAERGRFVTASGAEAEITWRVVAPGVISADRTFVPPERRGEGMAGKLTQALVDLATERDWKIIPACSYVATWAERHPEAAERFTDA